MISRNLTPDKTGMPAGGHALAEFLQIMTSGRDYDNLHPICNPAQLKQIEAGPPRPHLHSHFTRQHTRRRSSASHAMADVLENDPI